MERPDCPLDAIEAPIWRIDADRRYNAANRAYADFLGTEPEGLVGRQFGEAHPPDVAAAHLEATDRVFREGRTVRTEERMADRSGSERVFAVTRSPKIGPDRQVEAVVCVAVDITDVHREAADLARQVREKQALMREVHHRVKNDLAELAGLLQLQVGAVESGADPAHALQASADRVLAMAQLHAHIFETRGTSRVRFRSFLEPLLDHLKGLYAPDGLADVVLASDDVEVGVRLAVPLAIVVNELVTNALKHAFPARRGGRVTVTVSGDDSSLTVLVADDGIGSAAAGAGADGDGTSLGLMLVRELCEQMRASLDVAAEGGTRVTIVVPLGL